MNPTPFIFTFNNLDVKEVPNYYEYGFVIEGIKTKLVEELGIDFTLYADDETSDELFEVLEEDIKDEKREVTFISHLFDGLETSTISSNHTDKKLELIVKPRILNSLYYYSTYKVALAKVTIFQNEYQNEYSFVLAESNESMVTFLQYVLQRKREYHKNYVTVFTDTDDGIERTTEKITTLVSREDVILEEGLKKEIYRSIDQFFKDDGHFFTTNHIPYKRGILLYGKPGNGKTTLVKSIATSIEAPVVYWQITEHTSSYTIREVFSSIAKMTPMTLVVEDIDSMPKEVRSVFLNILDGSTSKEGIFIIGTTNYPEKIDPALINRSGRFDRAYELKLPTLEMRKSYLLRKKVNQFITDEEVERLVANTESFSFAQINELYTSIALQCHYEGKVDLDAICKDLQKDNKKSKTSKWDSEQDSKVGFF